MEKLMVMNIHLILYICFNLLLMIISGSILKKVCVNL